MSKYELKAKTYLAKENDPKIKEIADKHGIVMPSDDLAIFISVYAPLEEANLNGVRLATKAVEESLKTLNGKLADVDHIRPYVIGSILEGWINENGEIVIAFTMYKSVFVDEYAQALELMNDEKLSVSFELNTNPDTIEHLADKTIRLHEINFSGVGLLLNTKPAYPKAKVYEMANRLLNKVKETNMVFASQIAEELGSNVISEIEKISNIETKEESQMENVNAAKWTTKYIDTLPNSSFAVIEPAYLDGKTDDKNARHLPFKDENGKVDLPHLRNALARVNQIKPVTDSISADDLRAKAESELKKYTHLLKTAEQIAEIKTKLGDKVKDWSDEDFDNEAKLVEAGYTVETVHDCKQVKEVNDNGDAKVTTTDNTTTTVTDGEGNKSVQTEQNQNVCTYTQEQVDQMVQPYATQATTLQSELDAIKAEYEIAKNRIKELEDANTAREAAVVAEAKAKELQAIKDSLKDNPYVKEFKDEDFLNVEKVEKAKLLKENDDLKAKIAEKTTVTASDEKQVLVTGHEETTTVVNDDANPRKIIQKLGKD